MTNSKSPARAGARPGKAPVATALPAASAQLQNQARDRSCGPGKSPARAVSSSSIHVSCDVLRTVQQQQLIRIAELELSLSINVAELKKLRELVARAEGTATIEPNLSAVLNDPKESDLASATPADAPSTPSRVVPGGTSTSVPSNSSISSGQTTEQDAESTLLPPSLSPPQHQDARMATATTATSRLSPVRKNKRSAPAGVVPLKLGATGERAESMRNSNGSHTPLNNPATPERNTKAAAPTKSLVSSDGGASPLPIMSPVSHTSRELSPKNTGLAGPTAAMAVPASPAYSSVASTASSRPYKRMKKGGSAASSGTAEGQTRYWNRAEHERFLLGLQVHGLKSYTAIAATVGTRTAQQVRTHAQKYEMKLEREAQRRGLKSESLALRYPTLSLSEACGTARPAVLARAASHLQLHDAPEQGVSPASIPLTHTARTSSTGIYGPATLDDCARSPVTGSALPPVLENPELAGSHVPGICHDSVNTDYDFILMSRDDPGDLLIMEEDDDENAGSVLGSCDLVTSAEYEAEPPLSVPYVLENPDFNSLFVAQY
ncbi:Myb-like protein J [Porphyridium purpureum]|uniref:Myb-like protein J n=1 Tax=Porphyridium purpureum TaxID=35688 RepID=A0A5J4Z580_PORPP|nr:Myb-like protein J [Porphyridium purpureum]|eukprot:POR1230..scf295_1